MASKEASQYTDREVLALLAPLVKEDMLDLDHYVIITRGKCHTCSKRDGIALLTDILDEDKFIELVMTACKRVIITAMLEEGTDQ